VRTLAVVADTHLPRGSRQLPDECLELMRAADVVIHAGDFSTLAVYEELAGVCRELVAVHGNVDDTELRRRLPERVELEVDGVRLGVIHDAGPARGRLARLRREFPDADGVVFGHSHLPLHEAEAGFQIFNPGSPTERRRAPHRSMGVGEAGGGRIALRHRVL
jgi:putative phosphoesterase